MWALGVVLYQLMTLKHPFGSGLSDSHPIGAAELKAKVLEGKYDEPLGYSEDLLAVLRSLLRLDPRERASVKDLVENPFVHQAIQVMEAQFRYQSQPPQAIALPLSDPVLYREYNEGDPEATPKLHKKILTVDDNGVTLSADPPSSDTPAPAHFGWDEVMLATVVRHMVSSPAYGEVATEFLRLHIAEDFLESAYDVKIRGDKFMLYLTAINTKIAQRANDLAMSQDTPLS